MCKNSIKCEHNFRPSSFVYKPFEATNKWQMQCEEQLVYMDTHSKMPDDPALTSTLGYGFHESWPEFTRNSKNNE